MRDGPEKLLALHSIGVHGRCGSLIDRLSNQDVVVENFVFNIHSEAIYFNLCH